MSLLKNKPINIKRDFYVMNSGENTDEVEVIFYGEVVEKRPYDYWNDCPAEGNFIILKDFLDDLDRISGHKKVVFRINSYGGDATSGIAIHNRIKEMKAETECIIDGVAMSAASIIAVACDRVRVNTASLFMIHKASVFMFDRVNADDISQVAEMLKGYDKAVASAYSAKTGLSEVEILHMMGKTTYLTGKEAVDKGFADEIYDEEPISLSASADGKTIFMNGRGIHLAHGLYAPEGIPTAPPKEPSNQATPAAAVEANIKKPAVTGKEKGGTNPMTKDELRAQHPELVAEVEAEALAGQTEAIEAAVKAERDRLSQIDSVASLFSDELVQEAKYGETRCTAEQLSFRAAVKAKEQGKAFLADMNSDSNASGSGDVTSAPAPADKPDEAKTPEEKQAEADAIYKAALNKN